jgi:YD repeat-containing protein
VYDLSRQPACAAAILRETHARAAAAAGVPSRLQYAFEYSDGLGHVAMRKAQAEPGKAKQVTIAPNGAVTVTEVDTTPALRWVGNGRTVLNNKGNPVLQYEPFFSVTHGYESAREVVELGVTPVNYYDPMGRLVRTEQPDGSFSRVEFDPWHQLSFDRNDTVLSSDWYQARIGGALGEAEKNAAQKAALHDGTPALAQFDSLGRAYRSVAHNRFRNRKTKAVQDEFYASTVHRDVLGRELRIIDPRGNQAMAYAYDLAGRQASHVSMDAGERWALTDVAGQALYGWDAKGNRFHTVYDGAGSGIGRATAILFAGEGAKVAVAEIDPTAAEETAQLAGNASADLELRSPPRRG